MGSDRSKIIARCCYAAVTLITLSVMFWIAWCLFGLTAVQVSEAQRRAYVNYAPAKSLTSTTTSSPVSSTTLATIETSVNSISKVPTTASLGSKQRKETPNDSYSRSGQNATSSATINNVPPAISSSRESPSRNDNERAAILTGSSNEEEGIYARRGLPPGPENRPEEKSDRQKVTESTPEPRYDTSSSTRAYDSKTIIESSRRQESPVDRSRIDDRTATRDYIGSRDDTEPSRRYDIQSSRRSDHDIDPVIDSREYAPVSSSSRARPAYDDTYEEREPGSRYDSRDRRRDRDDVRPAVRDTKVYEDGDRLMSRTRDRYPDDTIRRDDDRYDDRLRDREDRVRPSVRESTRYDVRDLEDRSKARDDRYRDEGRYRTRIDEKDIDRDADRYRPREEDRDRYRDDERYRDRDIDRDRVRDADRYRDRDEDRYRDRGDDRYKDRDGGRYRDRDDDRYKDEDRYIERDGDRYRDRKDDRYKGDDDRYRDRDDDKYTDRNGSRYKDRDSDDDRYRYRYRDEDRYRQEENYRSKYDDKYESRDDERYRTGTIDRKDSSSSSRYAFSSKVDDRVGDYDVPARDNSRSRESTSRLPRPSYEDEEKYRRQSDSDRRRPEYENDRRDIIPTRTVEKSYPSRSSLIDTRPREVNDDSRYDTDRDSLYYDQRDRIQSTRPQVSRSSSAMIDASRRYVDDGDRFQTRLPNERAEDSKPSTRDEVSLDRRSYGSEEEEYRNRYSDSDSKDRNPRPVDDSRRRDRNDESYSRRDSVDDDYKDRRPTDYERDRRRDQDRYDEDYRRYDDRYDSKNEERYSSREDRIPPLPVRRYDSYPNDNERPRRVDPDLSSSRTRDSVDRDVRVREEERTYGKSEYVESKSAPRRRYDEEFSSADSRDHPESRRYPETPRRASSTREPVIQPSMTTTSYWREPTDVVVREKRFQTTEDRYQNSRSHSDDVYDDRSYVSSDSSKARESLRPLSPREVIEAAIRHSDSSDQDSRKVNYPLFDPIQSNMTSPDIIRPNERRGTIISSRKKRFS